MITKSYVREIEGLRGLAVLLVLLYHFEAPGFGAGFYGVDAFFVISGYLITGLLWRHLSETGRIPLEEFYLGRMRRVLPPLYVTLIATFWISALYMSPSALGESAMWTLQAAFGVSNIGFFGHSEYFNRTATTWPLLHTWSLGVEEQFYLIWPFLLWSGYRLFSSRARRWALAAAALSSFAACVYFWALILRPEIALAPALAFNHLSKPAAIFYLLPFRAYEFLLGAAVLALERRKPSLYNKSSALCFISLAALVLASSILPAKAGIGAIVPSLATAGLLLSARSAGGWLLRTTALTKLGKISYSLYLVHWPVIVFINAFSGHGLSVSTRLLAAVISTLLSLLLYAFVESPGRRREWFLYRKHWRFALPVLALGLLLLPAGHALRNGWPQRFPADFRQLLEVSESPLQNHSGRDPGCSFWELRNFRADRCLNTMPNMLNVLVWGDSFGESVWVGLRQALPKDRYNILQFTPPRCSPGDTEARPACPAIDDYIRDFIAHSNLDEIVITGVHLERVVPILTWLKSHSRRAIVVGPPFYFRERLPDLLAPQFIWKTFNKAQIDKVARRSLEPGWWETMNSISVRIVANGTPQFDLRSVLCEEARRLETCHFIKEGALLTLDRVHLTPSISRLLFINHADIFK